MRLSFFSARRTIPFVMVALLLAGSLLWVGHIVGMQEGDTMESCLLAGGRVMLCTLDAVAQVRAWQGMFAAALPLTGALLFLTFARLVVGRAASARPLPGHTPFPAQQLHHRFREWLPREPLREAFSQGILHPKLYDSALH